MTNIKMIQNVNCYPAHILKLFTEAKCSFEYDNPPCPNFLELPLIYFNEKTFLNTFKFDVIGPLPRNPTVVIQIVKYSWQVGWEPPGFREPFCFENFDLKVEFQTLWKNSIYFNVAQRKIVWQNPKSKFNADQDTKSQGDYAETGMSTGKTCRLGTSESQHQ